MAYVVVIWKFSPYHRGWESLWARRTETFNEAQALAQIVRSVIAALGFRENYFEVSIEDN